MKRVDFITRIPPEVLGVIFVHCSFLDADAPLVLSTVSRIFQRVVGATPRVWRRLRLRASESNDVVCVRKSQLWFLMGGACSLEVSVEIEFGKDLPALRTTSSSREAVKPPHLRLLAFLRRKTVRISSLHLRSPTEEQARMFLTSMYDSSETSLDQLILDITSDACPLRNRFQPPSPGTLPSLSSLVHLKVSSHLTSYLLYANLQNLRSLIIKGPLRSSPVLILTLLDILRSILSLEYFEMETRIVSEIAPSNPLPNTATSSAGEHAMPPSELITLPYLNHLSLRTNNVPAILERLLVPNLSSLYLDDLDGKRPGSAEEMGVVLRQLLVRMDLPNDHRQGDAFLHDLKLVGVGIFPKRDLSLGGAEDIWEWCFRRMRSLKNIIAENVDNSVHLLKLLTSPAIVSSGKPEFPCPGLTRLRITDSTVPSMLDAFRLCRPNVHIEFDIMADPFANDPADPFNPNPVVKFHSLYP